MTAVLTAARRRAVNIDAMEVIATDGQHGQAAPNLVKPPGARR